MLCEDGDDNRARALARAHFVVSTERRRPRIRPSTDADRATELTVELANLESADSRRPFHAERLDLLPPNEPDPSRKHSLQ
jgi:hypothetical protein